MEERDLPVHVREEMEKEMDSIDTTGSQNRQVTIKYLETLLDIPWNESTEDSKDLKKAE
jgi:ATP-dependent Lon protease